MKYSKYPSYKDSGVEWLGEIPLEWTETNLKYIADINMGQSPSSSTYNNEGIGIEFLQGNADFGDKFPTARIFTTEPKKLSNPEDILFTVRAPVGAMNIGKNKYAIGRGLCAINSTKHTKKAFLWWLMAIVKSELDTVATGSTYEAVSVEQVNNAIVLLPSLQEQKAIATYLDRATQKIDTLIAKQSRLIALLKEKRQALISHAVTKGLNPDAKMKESGVEWLGKIPAGWEVKKLKHIGEAIIGLTYSPKDITDEAKGTLVLRSSNLQNGGLYYGDNVYVKSVIPYKLITRAGDIVICSRNGSRKLIGKNAMIDEASEGVSFGAFTSVFRSSQNPFVFYILNSSLFKYQSGRFMTTTINQLTTGTLNEFKIALPPKEEQQKITIYLDQKTKKIDTLITKATEAITLLKEKRTALISAVVTGKVDVRGEAREGALGQDVRGEVT